MLQFSSLFLSLSLLCTQSFAADGIGTNSQGTGANGIDAHMTDAHGTGAQTTNAHWTDGYELTTLQINLLLKWEGEQKFDHEKLVGFAKSFEKHNLKAEPYVPPHTFAELIEVSAWAEGAAFATFAEYAGYTFDNEAYNAACPNRVLFNFGYATGKEYFRVDVLVQYMSLFDSLQITYALHPSTFPQKYLELAKSRGFDVYLRTAVEMAQNSY